MYLRVYKRYMFICVHSVVCICMLCDSRLCGVHLCGCVVCGCVIVWCVFACLEITPTVNRTHSSTHKHTHAHSLTRNHEHTRMLARAHTHSGWRGDQGRRRWGVCGASGNFTFGGPGVRYCSGMLVYSRPLLIIRRSLLLVIRSLLPCKERCLDSACLRYSSV